MQHIYNEDCTKLVGLRESFSGTIKGYRYYGTVYNGKVENISVEYNGQKIEFCTLPEYVQNKINIQISTIEKTTKI